MLQTPSLGLTSKGITCRSSKNGSMACISETVGCVNSWPYRLEQGEILYATYRVSSWLT